MLSTVCTLLATYVTDVSWTGGTVGTEAEAVERARIARIFSDPFGHRALPRLIIAARFLTTACSSLSVKMTGVFPLVSIGYPQWGLGK